MTPELKLTEQQKRDLDYAWEQLHHAVINLSCMVANIKDRLAAAAIHRITILRSEWMPTEELQKLVTELQEELSNKTALSSEGTIKATISEMTDDEASKWAEKIVSLYDSVTRYQEPW